MTLKYLSKTLRMFLRSLLKDPFDIGLYDRLRAPSISQNTKLLQKKPTNNCLFWTQKAQKLSLAEGGVAEKTMLFGRGAKIVFPVPCAAHLISQIFALEWMGWKVLHSTTATAIMIAQLGGKSKLSSTDNEHQISPAP